NNSIGRIQAAGEANVERAHVIKAKHHYAHHITRTFRPDERLERVFVYARAVQRDDLVLRVQALLVRGRPGPNALYDHKAAIALIFQVSATKGFQSNLFVVFES